MIIIIIIIMIIIIRRVDVSHCPLVKRPTHGRRHCCRLTHWRSGQKEPWRIQGWLIIIGLEIVDEAFIYLGLYLPGSVKAIANCDILIHRFSGKWMTNTLQHFQENIDINGELEIILNTILNQDYTYYFVPAPWLSVKLLRLLQNYQPPEDPGVQKQCCIKWLSVLQDETFFLLICLGARSLVWVPRDNPEQGIIHAALKPLTIDDLIHCFRPRSHLSPRKSSTVMPRMRWVSSVT